MTRIQRIGIVIAVCALTLPGVAQDKAVVQSRPMTTPVQVDGSAAEWPADGLTVEKEVNVSCAFQNDASSLYVLFQFNDSKFISSIEATGLTLWVNADGKERKNYGLRFYRKTVAAEDLIKVLESEGQTLSEDKKKELMGRPQYQIWTSDAINKKGSVLPHPGVSGGTYRTAKSAKAVVYELKLPLALLADPGAEKKWDGTSPLRIGFEWGGVTEEMKKAQASELGGQEVRASSSGTDLGSQAYGGEGAGLRAPSGSLAALRALSAKYKKYEFWLDLQIAPGK